MLVAHLLREISQTNGRYAPLAVHETAKDWSSHFGEIYPLGEKLYSILENDKNFRQVRQAHTRNKTRDVRYIRDKRIWSSVFRRFPD